MNDVHLIGIGSSYGGFYALHYDGRTFTTEQLHGDAPAAVADIYRPARVTGVWGNGPDDAVAVGEMGTIWMRSGRYWERASDPPGGDLTHIEGFSADDIEICGGDVEMQWEGGAWQSRHCGLQCCMFRRLGGFIDSEADEDRLGLDEGEPLVAPDQIADQVTIETDAGSFTFMVGAGGLVLELNPERAGRLPSGTRHALSSVHGTSPQSVFAVGEQGTILHYDGRRLRSQRSGTRATLMAVWALSPETAFAAGTDGTLLRFTSGLWQRVPTGTDQDILALWGSSATDLYAVGTGGTILHWDGTSWSTQASGTDRALLEVWGSGPDNVVVVGEAETILRRRTARQE